jgi:glycosyltransferase involved in cell wall biosynthesis
MSEFEPKNLSIVVPVFNGKKYIKATIESLIRISKQIPIEVIFQDAMSTDGTSEIIEEYVLQNNFFTHYREKDNGQSDAINKAIAKAHGEWVTWLCADDLLLDGFAEMMLFVQKKGGIDVVYGDCVFLENDQAVPAIGTEEYIRGKLIQKRLFIQQPGTCIRKDKWIACNGLDTKLNWTMDYNLFINLDISGCSFLRYNSFISVARIHGEAKTSSGSFWRFVEYLKIFIRAHLRAPHYFSFRPYNVYFLEYVIKNLESRKKGAKILPTLHSFFWKLAKPDEQVSINQRFQECSVAIQENIKDLN